MPGNNLQQAQELVDRYLKLVADQKTLQSQIDELKQTIADFSKTANLKHLKSGNNILKVSQGLKTVFPKVDETGRNELMKIMYGSKEPFI